MRAISWLNPIRNRWSKRLVFVLLAAVLISAIAVQWGRPIVADRIARSARQSEKPEREYEMLVTMGEAGLASLVLNALDPDPRIAPMARKAIHTRIDAWRAATNLANQSELYRKSALLVQLLNQSTPMMTRSGVAWSERLSHQLLELTPKLSAHNRVELITKIDRLLAEIARQPMREDLVLPEEIETAKVVAESQTIDLTPQVFRSESELPEPVAESLPAPPLEADDSNSLAIVSETQTQPKSLWKPDWQESSVPEPEAPELEAERIPTRPQSVSESFAAMTDRELLAELLANAETLRTEALPRARGPNGRREPAPLDPKLETLRLTLAERGYSGVTLSHLEMLLSDSKNDRLELVNRLMTERSGDSARLLFLLASDSNASVRLAAVTALGASNQRNLVEAAWSIALREKDPRFAEVAERLQSRLR